MQLKAGPRATMMPIAICVPVRDEAATLPPFFAAIDRLACDGIAPRLCLLLDSCRDASATLAHAYAARATLPVLVEQASQPEPNAGRARHAAMRLGQRVLNGAGWLLTTDADSAPAPDWLQAMAAGLCQADVVAGRVVRRITQPNPLQDRIERYYEALYAVRRAIDPVAWEAAVAHHQASGANLGISAENYRALGGFLPLASGEDARLVDDASRAGMRVRRDAGSLVTTSDRRRGRVANGLAGSLRALDEDGDAVTVAHPRDTVWQYRHQAAARLAFRDQAWTLLARAIGLTVDHLVGVARDCPNGEAFAMRVVPTPPGGMRFVTLEMAEAEVAALSAARRAA